MEKETEKNPNLILLPTGLIERRIYLIRGRKVMFDVHLAELYGVPTSALNQAVKRNRDRFPAGFMFQLNRDEFSRWISQIVISNVKAKMGLRKPPYVFTEQGVAMLSSVLRSDRAVKVNIIIMRTFVKLREIMATHADLANKISALEEKYGKHDRHIQTIFKIIKQLLEPPEPESEKSPIGFRQG